MRFIEVKTLEDGVLQPAFRVFADGRYSGPPSWKQTVERMSMIDPKTGERAADGEGVLRAIYGLFANRSQTQARIGDDSAESAGQEPDAQPRVPRPAARPATR